MRIFSSAAFAAAVVLATLSSASAYQEYNNASIGLANGELASLDKLAADYCVKKGFKGAEAFEFTGFQPNGNSVNAVFASVKCTLVAGVRVNEDGSRSSAPAEGGSGVNYHALYQSQGGQAVANAVSGGSTIGGSGLSGKLGL